MSTRRWWRIAVEGYGDFGFYGTESEAEAMRSHKAEWEGGVGTKERIAPDSERAKAERVFTAHQMAQGVKLSQREREAVAGEVEP